MQDEGPRSRLQAELDQLQQSFMEMAGEVEGSVSEAVRLIRTRDPRRAEQLERDDDRIDALDVRIGERVVALLARQNPVAGDLRLIVAILRIAHELERIGDHAVQIARSCRALADFPPLPQGWEVRELGGSIRAELARVLEALGNRDAALARRLSSADIRRSDLALSASRVIVSHMLERPRYISPGLETLMVVHSLQRIGSLATNIAEEVVFLVEGRSIKHPRLSATEGK